MKKNLLFAAIAALTFASCSSDGEAPGDNISTAGQAIDFRTGMTKTTTTTLASMTDFSVSADRTPGAVGFDFMTDVSVARRGATSWVYGPVKFWPTGPDGTTLPDIHFFAYSPAGSRNMVGSMTHPGSPSQTALIQYTVPLTQEDIPVDFLVAATTVAGVVPPAAYPTVSLTFKHALSRVTFSAKNTAPDARFVIKGIQLVNLAQTGTISLKTNSIGWSSTVSSQDQKYVASFPKAGVFVPYNAAVDSDPTSYTSLTSFNEGLVVLPQTVSAGTTTPVTRPSSGAISVGSNTGAYVAVSYDVYDGASATVPFISETKYFPLAIQLDMATEYNLLFKLVAGGTVSFTVGNVSGWTSSSDTILP